MSRRKKSNITYKFLFHSLNKKLILLPALFYLSVNMFSLSTKTSVNAKILSYSVAIISFSFMAPFSIEFTFTEEKRK